ncbi:hypothetical protein C7448_101448 [Tenacibaculum gallaicum]|uniref:Uncharacterized protein n=2 Tax=Tenacibaculum gallaicum TaxID=561505 RepID=A0A3E0ICR9_9FLAO|nr:hypothetical protein C7448_101448 [Tenacibaculum gallaicum]
MFFSCLTLTIVSCESDDIEQIKSSYIDGGIGTSTSTGAVNFNFNIPQNHYTGHVRIIIHGPIGDQERTVSGKGNRQVSFSNVQSGVYDYTFEYYYVDNNYDYAGGEYDFSTKNWSNYYNETSYIPSLHKGSSISEVLEIKSGMTLVFDFQLN